MTDSGAGLGPTRVLYVGGTGRSGSTLLANVIGEVPGVVSAGEVRFVWERGVLQDRFCGCGERFSDCLFWREVIRRTCGHISAADLAGVARSLHAEIQARTRLRHLPLELARRRGGPRHGSSLREVLPRLYAAIATVADASVVVDSSKLPTYAMLLDDMPDLTISVAHLVRDARAAAFSWQRHKEQPDRGYPVLMERRGVTKSAALWSVWNQALEMLFPSSRGNYARLTYEQFVQSPEPMLAALLEDLDLSSDLTGVFADDRTVRLTRNHTVAGNPARLRTGNISLEADDEWRQRMPKRDRRIVSTISFAQLRRYGYLGSR